MTDQLPGLERITHTLSGEAPPATFASRGREDMEAPWEQLLGRVHASLRNPEHRHVDGERIAQNLAQVIQGNVQAGKLRVADRPRNNTYAFTSRRLAISVFGGMAVVAAVVFGISTRDAHQSVQFTKAYITQSAERAVLQLPDGSRVTLAPQTTLQYHAAANGERVADLDGQALFTIRQNASEPFIVRTGKVQTRVLGTTFDVKAYAPTRDVQILLVDGKVAVSRPHALRADRNHILTPGMFGVFSDSTAAISRAEDPETLTEWTRGRLVFRNTPISEVLETIGRWSGYRFRIADSALVLGRVTTVLMVDKPENTMRMLGDLLDAKVVVKDSVVTIYQRQSSGTRHRWPMPGTSTPSTVSGVGL